MLLNLHVKNLAIIDEIEVEFSEGLNVLTGETGAGKSIIIGSINIALGGKVSKDIIRTGTEFALVELTFLAEDSEQINSLEKLGITLEEDVVVISRKITKCRTINRVNGETVSVSMLKSIADILIDIHGQNEQQSLLYKNKHMEIVDRYAAEKMCGRDMEFSEMYRQYKDMLVKYSEKEMSEEERLREVSFIRYELEQIEQAHLVKGEEEKLQERYRYLSNANEIKSGINEVYSLVEDSYGDSQSVSQMLGRSSHILAKISGYDERLKELARQIADIDELIMDFNRDLQEYASDMDENGEEFAEVETRLDLVRTIKSKYGATTELVENYAKDLENKLEKYEAYEEYRANLEKKIEIYKIKLEKLGESISKIRKKCSAELEKRITDALIDLNFLQVKFEIAVRELDEFNSKGKDEVEFMISTNPGEDLKPIGQAASGGELSRIMLAIKAVLAEHDSIGTLIFDEIDVGISGRTAQKVAEKMAFIGHSHQVICISHLAQIAAMADHNYLIEKNNSLNKTSTVIRQLEGDEIVEEIARILGGAKITDAVLESAREMKQLADIEKINYKKVSRPA
ncbi:MAG: DNA repair protein RecN [Butyribacter sp.]|jgi:DNA repair protein RecN (Recombination protein N)|uniref:DNA repair protein RecN n=1 Tax=Butyribacter TaxID=2822463 RepID=UPI00033BE690|nr:DNA repair protein RecN [Butyribacter intestini]MBS5365065.1 DNA repair protein RecN [Clostridium sp.]MCQ5167359.1 DNA repair protein RecN [Roseburia hominis]CCZ42134.1 dNA repair protein RecN [Clostridium sp. CAG:122]